MSKKLPWADIERDYVEGIQKDGVLHFPTHTELSQQYKVDRGLLGRKASKDQWSVKREIFVSKVTAEGQQKKIEAISDAGSQFDLSCFNSAQTAIEILGARLEAARSACDIDEVSKISAALKNYQVIGRMALGLSTENVKSTSAVTVRDATRMDQD